MAVCSVCILGRGEMELVGAGDSWWEECLFPCTTLLSWGKMHCTSSVDMGICSHSTLYCSLYQYQKAFLLFEELHLCCCSWMCIFILPSWSNQMLPWPVQLFSWKILRSSVLVQQWLLYNISFKFSGLGFSCCTFGNVCGSTPSPPPLDAASSLACKLSEVPYWNKMFL